MKTSVLFCLFVSACTISLADTGGRPAMIDASARPEARLAVADNTDQIEIQEVISAIEDAFNAENVEGYSRCFKSSSRKSVRKKTAVLFASGEFSMDVEESHIIEVGDDEAEVAVKYLLGGQDGRSSVVSTVNFVKEDGFWVISSENMISKITSGRASSMIAKDEGGKWDPYKPDTDKVSNNLQHLIGDIGVRPGMGCADGKCANGRCER